jgi:membrane protein YqaA with SNARE-associated domain
MKKEVAENNRSFKHKMLLYHIYYRRTGLYPFLLKHTIRVLLGIGVLVVGLLALNKYVINVDDAMQAMFANFSDEAILAFFTLSEIILGLIPPDLFIVWAGGKEDPYTFLLLLAVLSYSGGMIAYVIGKYIGKVNSVQKYIQRKFLTHFDMIRKWGGFVVIFAALFPLPFSPVCMTAGMVRYPFPLLALFGLSRFARYYIYAAALFNLF